MPEFLDDRRGIELALAVLGKVQTIMRTASWLAFALMGIGWVACGGSSTSGSDTGGQAGANAGGAAGSGFDYTACTGPGTCMLQVTICCACDSQSKDWKAIANTQEAITALRDEVCPGGQTCDACYGAAPADALAVCNEGHWQRVDLYQSDLSACTQDSDCKLRYGNTCCEPCGDPSAETSLVAIAASKAGEYKSQVCPPAAPACPPCMPTYPAGMMAACGGNGHCEVRPL